jgi:hypothetical protein
MHAYKKHQITDRINFKSAQQTRSYDFPCYRFLEHETLKILHNLYTLIYKRTLYTYCSDFLFTSAINIPIPLLYITQTTLIYCLAMTLSVSNPHVPVTSHSDDVKLPIYTLRFRCLNPANLGQLNQVITYQVAFLSGGRLEEETLLFCLKRTPCFSTAGKNVGATRTSVWIGHICEQTSQISTTAWSNNRHLDYASSPTLRYGTYKSLTKSYILCLVYKHVPKTSTNKPVPFVTRQSRPIESPDVEFLHLLYA